MSRIIQWGSEKERLRYEDRLAQVIREGWIRAYDNPPEDGQSVLYTFPEMSNGEYEGTFEIDSKFVDIDGNEFDIGHDMHTFYSKHGYLGSEDVFWKPWPPEEER